MFSPTKTAVLSVRALSRLKLWSINRENYYPLTISLSVYLLFNLFVFFPIYYKPLFLLCLNADFSHLYHVCCPGPACRLFGEREELYAIARPSVCLSSVVCNSRAPYSGGWNFRQYFYGIWYLGHPLIFVENFTAIVAGEPLRQRS